MMTMPLSKLFADASRDPLIRELTLDSRAVRPGDLFLAVPGAKVDGRDHIADALAHGAAAVAYEVQGASVLPITDVPLIPVKGLIAQLSSIAGRFYGEPSRQLNLIGVTGTNGKTSVTQLVAQALDALGQRCGLIGTLGTGFYGELQSGRLTTPDPIAVQSTLYDLKKGGAKAVAMEVSSHALVQARVRGVEFDAAVFTNLTQDHLDYHETMEGYFAAKSLLFSGLLQQKKKSKAIINSDDRFGGRLVTRFRSDLPVVTYGLGAQADFRASNVRIDFHGTSYQLDASGRSYLVRLPLIGTFNVYNSLAALAAANALGVDLRNGVLALANARAVPGRLEEVQGKRQFKVFVDYAHTDDALLNVIKTCRELDPARLIVVFGCGGNRDTTKRPRMGAVVDEHADYAVVTSDNPRKEDPASIIDDIKQGMKRGRHEIIVDRKEAIFKAIAMAEARDIVLIAGKGHENYQEFADHTVPFDDVAVASQALEAKRVEFNRG